VQSVVTDTASSILGNAVTVVSALVAMLVLSWRLTLVAVVLLPLFVLLQVRVGRVRRRVAGATQRSVADMTAITQERLSVSGVLLTKVFDRQQAEIERYAAENAPSAWPGPAGADRDPRLILRPVRRVRSPALRDADVPAGPAPADGSARHTGAPASLPARGRDGHMTDAAPGRAAPVGNQAPGSATHPPGSCRETGRTMPDDLVVSEVPQDVASTVEMLTGALQTRGVAVFATIDHAAGARAAGLELDDEVLLVFGSPAVGTALMAADPRVGFDLPLRMLVWSRDGATRVGYQDPLTLADRYALGGERETLGKLRGLLEQLVMDVGEQRR
jgi:uncharacterized protein (DUF302 family)